MRNIQITKVTADDIKRLQKIGKQTFSEAFASGNSQENLTKYLDEGFSEEKLKAELSDSNSAFYFASIDNKVIGYLKLNISGSQTELKDEKALEIERIYVLKEFYGEGIGQMLCDYACKIAKETQMDYVWLGVWEENPRAIRFYEKNGFVKFGTHVFKLGDDMQTDIMMKRILNNSN